MSGRTDLREILESLEVIRRPGEFGYASIPAGDPLPEISFEALVVEDEGTTIVARTAELRSAGLSPVFEAAWLTIEAHTALEAIGLTAVLAARLTEAGIPANVVAGAYHDHLLVPVDDATRAIAALLGQQRRPEQ